MSKKLENQGIYKADDGSWTFSGTDLRYVHKKDAEEAYRQTTDVHAAPDQGNRTNELDSKILAIIDPPMRSDWKDVLDRIEWQHKEVERLISQEAAKLARAAIDGVTLNEIIEAGIVPTPEEHKNMLGLLDVVRRRLDALQGGTEG